MSRRIIISADLELSMQRCLHRAKGRQRPVNELTKVRHTGVVLTLSALVRHGSRGGPTGGGAQ